MRKMIVPALAIGFTAFMLSAVPADAARPTLEELPAGAILDIGTESCGGFGGCHTDFVTYFHNGGWERTSSNLPEPCDGRTTKEERRALREAKKALRPYAQANAFYTCGGGGADLADWFLRTVHGTISWTSGAEMCPRDSGMPQEVIDVIDALNTLGRDVTECACFPATFGCDEED